MNQLLNYLNSLDRAAQDAYALRCKTTVGYLRKACSTKQVIREIVCARLESESGGLVTRESLRPDDCLVIWPELDKSQARTGQAAIKNVAAMPHAVI